MVESNDGFYIAEMDMRLRGPGEFFGTKQSGLPSLRIANIIRDGEILEVARAEAIALVEHPPSQEMLRDALAYVQTHWQRRYGLGAGRVRIMRVIAGEFRSRVLKTLPGIETRPDAGPAARVRSSTYWRRRLRAPCSWMRTQDPVRSGLRR
jgi:hypothetical protein